jgi:hypothetical protein
MEQIIDVRVAPLEKGQRETVAILTRFERVLIGDVAYKQEGMVDKVQRHDAVIDGWKEEMSQTRGMVKATMMIGGIIITLVQIGVQVWFAKNGK